MLYQSYAPIFLGYGKDVAVKRAFGQFDDS